MTQKRHLLGPSSNLVLRGLINERAHVPDILLSGVVGPREANELFEKCVHISALCYRY
jgi:hypothetical protein